MSAPLFRPWALRSGLLTFAILFAAGNVAGAAEGAPLALHPDNGHYFLWRGKPTVIVTSGEHYGAVLNLDFDFKKYIDALAADGMNCTRTFTGAYIEPAGAFNISANTLAPRPERLICPWVRSDEPGFAGGGNKFDLTKWDEAYFTRLKQFVAYAAERGVIVELNLFCPMYEEGQWTLSPMNPANNVQGTGPTNREHVYTLDKNAGLLDVQERLVRRLAAELAEFDNLYYEICNEPYFGGVTLAWQRRIAQTLAEAEREGAAPQRIHLISQNIANNKAKIEDADPRVSIFNFHYAVPEAVTANYGLGKPIGDNETGFRGTGDATYRMEAWDFLLSGGALFNHLDYSFTPEQPDGTHKVIEPTPGGGGPTIRKQLKALADFMASIDFVHMRPDAAVVAGGLPEGVVARVLANPGREYAIYIRPADEKKPSAKALELEVDLPAGKYRAAWVNVLDGATTKQNDFDHAGGKKRLAAPPYELDAVVRIARVE